MSKVDFSMMESEQFGFRFGRCNAAEIEVSALEEGIQKHQLDVLRLRVSASDSNAIDALEKLGYPYYFSGGIRRYRVNCLEAPLPPFTDSDIHFELYTGQHSDKLELIMLESWGSYPLGYYKTPVLRDFISKEMESDCLFRFYSYHNNQQNFPNNYLWFVKKGAEYIGFIALYVYRDQDMVDSTIAGFRTSWQGKGLFPNILRHIRGFCREQGITYFCCGARNENVYSQWAFERDFMKGEGVEYVYHVLPMRSRIEKQSVEISTLELNSLLLKWAGEKRHQFSIKSSLSFENTHTSLLCTISKLNHEVLSIIMLPDTGMQLYSIPK